VKQIRYRNRGGDALERALPAPTRWLSTLPLLAAGLLAAPAHAAGRDSCPLTTSVSPFQATANPRYEIVLTDGGDGDSDGEVNGLCDAAVRCVAVKCRSARRRRSYARR
jgi:hypothetical protein